MNIRRSINKWLWWGDNTPQAIAGRVKACTDEDLAILNGTQEDRKKAQTGTPRHLQIRLIDRELKRRLKVK